MSTRLLNRPSDGDVDGAGAAIDLEIQHVAQAGGMPSRSSGFGKYGLRIEAGDKGLRADDVRDITGGDTDGAIGPEMDADARRSATTHQDATAPDIDPLAQASRASPA